jgi:hypothetical protein
MHKLEVKDHFNTDDLIKIMNGILSDIAYGDIFNLSEESQSLSDLHGKLGFDSFDENYDAFIYEDNIDYIDKDNYSVDQLESINDYWGSWTEFVGDENVGKEPFIHNYVYSDDEYELIQDSMKEFCDLMLQPAIRVTHNINAKIYDVQDLTEDQDEKITSWVDKEIDSEELEIKEYMEQTENDLAYLLDNVLSESTFRNDSDREKDRNRFKRMDKTYLIAQIIKSKEKSKQEKKCERNQKQVLEQQASQFRFDIGFFLIYFILLPLLLAFLYSL